MITKYGYDTKYPVMFVKISRALFWAVACVCLSRLIFNQPNDITIETAILLLVTSIGAFFHTTYKYYKHTQILFLFTALYSFIGLIPSINDLFDIWGYSNHAAWNTLLVILFTSLSMIKFDFYSAFIKRLWLHIATAITLMALLAQTTPTANLQFDMEVSTSVLLILLILGILLQCFRTQKYRRIVMLDSSRNLFFNTSIASHLVTFIVPLILLSYTELLTDNTDVIIFSLITMFNQMLLLFFSVKKSRIEFKHRKLNHYQSSLAHTDRLTGLHNRTHAYEKMRTGEYNDVTHICLFDIDNFKYVNDTFGHDAGDSIIKNIGNIIEKNIKSTDELVRWGGEEFIIFFRNVNNDDVVDIVEGLRRAVMTYDYYPYPPVTCSFGVVGVHDHNFKLAVSEADYRMYAAKKQGKNRVKSLLKKQSHELYAQTIVDISNNNEVYGVELLSRIPGVRNIEKYFMDLDSETAFDWLEYQMDMGQLLQEQTGKLVTVNIDKNTVKHIVWENLRHYNLGVEFTPTHDRFDDDFFSNIESYQSDMRIILDDYTLFGKTRAPATQFKHFDYVKLDKSCFDFDTQYPSQLKILKVTCTTFRTYGIKLIAEGIETEDQLDIVKECGINLVQGFRFSKPKPFAEVQDELLRAKSASNYIKR